MADDNEKKAKELMERSKMLKKRAAETEFRVERDYAAGRKESGSVAGLPTINEKGQIVRPSYSYGEKALKEAAQDRAKAKKDSLEAVNIMKPAAIVAPVKRPANKAMGKK